MGLNEAFFIFVLQEFNFTQEKAMEQYTTRCLKLNFGLRRNDVKFLTYQYVVKNGLIIRINWQKNK